MVGELKDRVVKIGEGFYQLLRKKDTSSHLNPRYDTRALFDLVLGSNHWPTQLIFSFPVPQYVIAYFISAFVFLWWPPKVNHVKEKCALSFGRSAHHCTVNFNKHISWTRCEKALFHMSLREFGSFDCQIRESMEVHVFQHVHIVARWHPSMGASSRFGILQQCKESHWLHPRGLDPYPNACLEAVQKYNYCTVFYMVLMKTLTSAILKFSFP